MSHPRGRACGEFWLPVLAVPPASPSVATAGAGKQKHLWVINPRLSTNQTQPHWEEIPCATDGASTPWEVSQPLDSVQGFLDFN